MSKETRAATAKLKFKQWIALQKELGRCTSCGDERDRSDRLRCARCRNNATTANGGNYYKLRAKVFDHYGRECVCCGEKHEQFLAIDHMPGAPSRKDHPAQSKNLTRWVVENGFPELFRILCHNCNYATRYGRVCPHKRTGEDTPIPSTTYTVPRIAKPNPKKRGRSKVQHAPSATTF